MYCINRIYAFDNGGENTINAIVIYTHYRKNLWRVLLCEIARVAQRENVLERG